MTDALRRRRRPAAGITGDTADGDGLVCISMGTLLAQHRGSESLALRARQVRSVSGGGYLSPFKGRGMEFDEVRPYVQGDDPRSIDWRVTARSGKAHTKLFREERERAVLLWIDLRAPMFFATRGAFKAVRAAQAAALLGWSALRRGDRLGALIFDEHHHDDVRPRRGQPPFLHLLRRLSGHPAWRGAGKRDDAQPSGPALQQALLHLRRVTRPGSLIVLLSDFAGIGPADAAHLAQLAPHNDVILIAIHDPLEAELPPPGRYRVGDGHRFLTIDTGDRRYRERYRRGFAARREQLEQLCRGHRITLLPLSTGDEPLPILQRGLGVRR
jgi:uncharacterized protein (DUF58 family)